MSCYVESNVYLVCLINISGMSYFLIFLYSLFVLINDPQELYLNSESRVS